MNQAEPLTTFSSSSTFPLNNNNNMLSVRQRLTAAKSILQSATTSPNPDHAEALLMEACDALETWAVDFEEAQILAARNGGGYMATSASRRSDLLLLASTANPFCVLLAQAKHRLAQVCLLKNNLETACRLFLQVLLHDPDCLSPTALAMAWYDVALIYWAFAKFDHARAGLEQASSVLMNVVVVNDDSTLMHFIRQAQKHLQTGLACQLPWSIQFTTTTYNYESSRPRSSTNEQQQACVRDSNEDDDLVLQEAQKMLDPKVRHAGAA